MLQVVSGETIQDAGQINHYLGILAKQNVLVRLGHQRQFPKVCLGVGESSLMLCNLPREVNRGTAVGTRVVAFGLIDDMEIVFESAVQKLDGKYLLVSRPSQLYRVRAQTRDNGRITTDEDRLRIRIDAAEAGVLTALSSDISTTGVGLEFQCANPDKIPKKEPLPCRMLLREECEIKCQLAILWMERTQSNTWKAGGRFIGLSDEVLQQIEQMVKGPSQ